MSDNKLRDLDAWISWNIFEVEVRRVAIKDGRKIVYIELYDARYESVKISRYTTSPAAAMEVMQACYKKYMNSYFASFHNFLMRKSHDSSFTPEQVCLFAKELFTK